MSAVAAIAIAVVGAVLVLGAVAGLVMWLRRTSVGAVARSADGVRQAVAARGWEFTERDDTYVALYDRQYDRRSRHAPLEAPPKAVAARDVVTGVHRGRKFVATTFDTRYQGKQSRERAIWVATPSQHPVLSIQRVAAAQSAANRAIGAGVGTDHPDFDRKFEVSSEHDQFARAVLGRELIQFLLGAPEQIRGVYLRGEVLDVLAPVRDHRNLDELVPALDLRCEILDRIPHQAWQ